MTVQDRKAILRYKESQTEYSERLNSIYNSSLKSLDAKVSKIRFTMRLSAQLSFFSPFDFSFSSLSDLSLSDFSFL